MTQKNITTTNDRFGGNNKENPEFSTGSKIGLDSMPHRSNTVRALRGSPLSTQKTEEDMATIRLLNIDQVCAALNMGRVKVYELINRKHLKSIKIGARRLVSVRALNDFIERLEE